MHHSFGPVSRDARLAPIHHDVADMDILELGSVFQGGGGLLLLGSHVVVEVSGLEDDGLVLP